MNVRSGSKLTNYNSGQERTYNDMDHVDGGFEPRKDFDIYSVKEDLRNYSDSDQPYDMKLGKIPDAK